jgi:hypothetical protein
MGLIISIPSQVGFLGLFYLVRSKISNIILVSHTTIMGLKPMGHHIPPPLSAGVSTAATQWRLLWGLGFTPLGGCSGGPASHDWRLLWGPGFTPLGGYSGRLASTDGSSPSSSPGYLHTSSSPGYLRPVPLLATSNQFLSWRAPSDAPARPRIDCSDTICHDPRLTC